MARRLIRKMRGGAQSHLLEADDGRFYVVKFQNNPQHRRILVNEWVSAVFLRYLRISSPPGAFVCVTEDFLAANPDVYLQLGTRRVSVAPGWHFGSRYPGDPATQAVYDFLPDSLLAQVQNRDEFLGALAFDKWMGNADARQSIFFRPQKGGGFLGLMMDHGYVFNGPHWGFADAPLQGLYFRAAVYERVRSLGDFEPWLERIAHFPEEVVDEAYRQIPPEWVEGEEAEFERLLSQLLTRRKRVADLLRSCHQARISVFPNWR